MRPVLLSLAAGAGVFFLYASVVLGWGGVGP